MAPHGMQQLCGHTIHKEPHHDKVQLHDNEVCAHRAQHIAAKHAVYQVQLETTV
jgi:hypothetical protein